MTRLDDRLALSYLGFHRHLAKAAGISAATVVCHPETWAVVTGLAKSLREVCPDAPAIPVCDGDGEIVLSGAAVAAVMHVLRTAWFYTDVLFVREFPAPRRAVARRVYLEFAHAVDQVSATADGVAPRVVLDDRMPRGT